LSTLDHGSSEFWVDWGQRGGLALPRVSLAFKKIVEGQGEGKGSSLSLSSLDVKLSGGSSTLELSDLSSGGGSGGGGGGGGGVRRVGGVQNSSGSSLGCTTVDVSANISGTRDGESLSTLS